MQIRPLSSRDYLGAEPTKRPARPDDEAPDEVAFVLPSTPPRERTPPPSEPATTSAPGGRGPSALDSTTARRADRGASGQVEAPIDPPRTAPEDAARKVKSLDEVAALELPEVEAQVASTEPEAASPEDPQALDAAALARAVRAAQVAVAERARTPDTSALATLGLIAVEPGAPGDPELDAGADRLELDGPDGVDGLGELGADGAFDLPHLALDRLQPARAPERVLGVDPGRPIADQVADAVKKLAADAASDGVIRVRGGAAGDFSAHVRQDGLQLSLRLVAEGGAQRGALEQRLPELRQALVRAGYHPDTLDVTTSDRHAPRRDAHRGRADQDADDGIEFVL
ncbi:MAG: flagellar hook-length control protein FliK [Deltaproteobacteria bacterium]|nr:flagellar hook-length control protein FliK [Deltaproteobacteria bacterium]